MRNANTNLIEYDKDNISEKKVAKATPLLQDPRLEPEVIDDFEQVEVSQDSIIRAIEVNHAMEAEARAGSFFAALPFGILALIGLYSDRRLVVFWAALTCVFGALANQCFHCSYSCRLRGRLRPRLPAAWRNR